MTVLVVGAGPTGLTAACGLLARGVPVRVVDGASGPATTSRALGLQPRGQEVLRRVGAFGDLPQRSIDVPEAGIRVHGRKVVDVGAALDTSGPRMLWLPQTEIEAQLRVRLSALGGEIEWDSPVLGVVQDDDGANAGIGDAENAAFKLALVIGGHAGPGLLDTYSAERRPVAQAVLSATSVGTKLGFAETRAGRRLFAMLAPLLRIPVVQRRLMRAASQLDTSYRSGLLADSRGRTRHVPQPGDRVPNIPTRDAAGKKAPLHNHLGTGWALLTDGSADGPLREAARRLGADHVRELTPQTGALREVLLVRPDAHLAWRGTHSADLAQWLDSMLAS